MTSGKNQQDIKLLNRALVFRLICTGQSLSRIDIARLTGLSKMTVSNIVAQLMRDGLVREGDFSETMDGVGRKPIVLLPREESVFVQGVYISRDSVKVSLLSLSAKILKTAVLPLTQADSARTLLDKALQGLRKVAEGIAPGKIRGIGVASIGPLDRNRGVILAPPDFYGIRDVPIREFLEENTGQPILVDNDMKASALAERLYGKGRGLQNFLYLGITRGIGAGIVVDGKLFGGEMGHAGEIGHTSINFSGPLCTCGNRGCLEVYTSIPNILRSTRELLRLYPDSVLAAMGSFTFRDIAENADADRLCRKVIDQLAEHLGIGLVNAVNTLDLSTVIIGHEGAFGGVNLIKPVERYINEKMLYKSSKQVTVEISQFLDQSPMIGSGVLALDEMFNRMSRME